MLLFSAAELCARCVPRCVAVCGVSLAPVDSSLDGLHLAQHGQQQGGFPTTHLAHDHCQLTWTQDLDTTV